MKLFPKRLLSAMLLLLWCASNASAVMWEEASQGDFSGDFTAPTDLGTLALGSNTLSGRSTAGPTEDLTMPAVPGYPEIDVDLWKLLIASRQFLNQIVI